MDDKGTLSMAFNDRLIDLLPSVVKNEIDCYRYDPIITRSQLENRLIQRKVSSIKKVIGPKFHPYIIFLSIWARNLSEAFEVSIGS